MHLDSTELQQRTIEEKKGRRMDRQRYLYKSLQGRMSHGHSTEQCNLMAQEGDCETYHGSVDFPITEQVHIIRVGNHQRSPNGQSNWNTA